MILEASLVDPQQLQAQVHARALDEIKRQAPPVTIVKPRRRLIAFGNRIGLGGDYHSRRDCCHLSERFFVFYCCRRYTFVMSTGFQCRDFAFWWFGVVPEIQLENCDSLLTCPFADSNDKVHALRLQVDQSTPGTCYKASLESATVATLSVLEQEAECEATCLNNDIGTLTTLLW